MTIIESTQEEPQKRFYLPTARRILRETCERYGLSEESVLSARRDKHIVDCRSEAIWLIAKETGLTLSAMGRFLGRAHTSVIHSIRRHNEATGENVRKLGNIPAAQKARNLAFCRKRKVIRSREEAR